MSDREIRAEHRRLEGALGPAPWTESELVAFYARPRPESLSWVLGRLAAILADPATRYDAMRAAPHLVGASSEQLAEVARALALALGWPEPSWLRAADGWARELS